MTQPFPCTRLEEDFARLIGRTPSPEAPINNNKEDNAAH